ncbi:uncharacterized protein LOC120617602 isoform X2 [Pteropus medius]|uniref:uncharacterized protein LOC120617602 isoform X2 n=1 Tax=Pteropus vampyrus TaxID=132908 RepID=UPI00196B91B3|nr:uncharacterized protein LOC120617602 isoform X2 [Pteropus giganteus]
MAVPLRGKRPSLAPSRAATGRAGAERRKEGSGRSWSSGACPARPPGPRHPLQPPYAPPAGHPNPGSCFSGGGGQGASASHTSEGREDRRGPGRVRERCPGPALRCGALSGTDPLAVGSGRKGLRGVQMWDVAQPEQKLRKQPFLPELRGKASFPVEPSALSEGTSPSV